HAHFENDHSRDASFRSHAGGGIDAGVNDSIVAAPHEPEGIGPIEKVAPLVLAPRCRLGLVGGDVLNHRDESCRGHGQNAACAPSLVRSPWLKGFATTRFALV